MAHQQSRQRRRTMTDVLKVLMPLLPWDPAAVPMFAYDTGAWMVGASDGWHKDFKNSYKEASFRAKLNTTKYTAVPSGLPNTITSTRGRNYLFGWRLTLDAHARCKSLSSLAANVTSMLGSVENNEDDEVFMSGGHGGSDSQGRTCRGGGSSAKKRRRLEPSGFSQQSLRPSPFCKYRTAKNGTELWAVVQFWDMYDVFAPTLAASDSFTSSDKPLGADSYWYHNHPILNLYDILEQVLYLYSRTHSHTYTHSLHTHAHLHSHTHTHTHSHSHTHTPVFLGCPWRDHFF
jgi:hypothetical protein